MIESPSAVAQLAPTPPAPTAVAAFVGALHGGPANIAVLIEDYGYFEAIFGTDSTAMPTALAVRQFFDNGGKEAYVVRSAADAGVGAHRALHQGVFALEEVELFNLLCLPGTTDGKVLGAAEAYCRDRGAVLLMDAPPEAETSAQLLAALAAWPRSSHAAAVHPWVYVQLEGGKRLLAPPCGSIAGMLARNDVARGVWKAPAGRLAHLEGVCALHADVTEADAEMLARAGVNCLRMASSLGAACLSARTLHPDDMPMPQLAHLPVRRMANFLADSLGPALEWTRFERNDESLWARIRAQAGRFMHELFTAGAFRGDTEAEAYSVRCGMESISSEDLSQGRVGIDLEFAPLAPAQFVHVRAYCLAEPR
jgi:phage tail sheath protein FI